MIKKIIVVYDAKAKAYGDPITFDSVGRAVRCFSDLVNDSVGNDVSKHPEDFSLYHIADYDVASGIITMLDKPVSLGRAIEFKNEVPNG